MKKILFNLSHWCLNYDDYENEKSRIIEVETENKKEEIRKRGYMEKSDLSFFYEYPMGSNLKKQEIRTSGSTGHPIRFWCDSRRIASSLALVDYRFKQIGLKEKDVFMRFWYPTTGHTKLQILKEKLFRWYTKEKFFSYFDLINGEKTIVDFINFVNKHKPDFIEGYAGGIVAVASYIKDNKILVNPVKTIVTGAGMVKPKQHELIEETFRCKHYDRYGCSEFGEIAHQIGEGYYETNPFLTIYLSNDLKKFYSLKEAKDGDYEIFITDPRNMCTPFWRYRMNDIVTIKNNKIVQISGRTEKMYEISEGEFVPTGFFYQSMKDFSNIDQWQIELDSKSRNITVRTLPRLLDEDEQRSLEKYFGKNNFTFNYVKNNFTTVGRRQKLEEIIVHEY